MLVTSRGACWSGRTVVLTTRHATVGSSTIVVHVELYDVNRHDSAPTPPSCGMNLHKTYNGCLLFQFLVRNASVFPPATKLLSNIFEEGCFVCQFSGTVCFKQVFISRAIEAASCVGRSFNEVIRKCGWGCETSNTFGGFSDFHNSKSDYSARIRIVSSARS